MGRVSIACGLALAAAMVSAWAESGEYGADANPTGDPIGGGRGYRRIVERGDYTVRNADELLVALKEATPGQVVYVDSGAEVDLSGRVNTAIPDGVTLAGDRGRDGSPGPLLFTRDIPKQASLLSARSNTRVTGLRIRGADPNFPDIDYDEAERSWTRAIVAWGADIEIDNCEISNFHHSGVSVQGQNVRVRHCHIHDVHAYPVVTADKMRPPMLIEACRIHWVWHTIAGTGAPGTGYEARYNLCIRDTPPASWGPKHKSHGFDMHAYRPVSRSRKRRIAGDRISIHHNTMLGLGPALGARIRGIPREVADVHHNWFSEADPAMALAQVEPVCNVWVHDNVYGPGKTHVAVGPQTVPRIRWVDPPPPERDPAKVDGELCIALEASALGGHAITNVTVELDKKPVYTGPRAPQGREAVADTAKLANGLHEIAAVVTDSRGATARYAIDIEVAN